MNIKFELSRSGRLRGVYSQAGLSFAVLRKMDLESLKKPGATIPWTIGSSEYLPTDLVENNRPVRLEAVIFKPPGKGPFPLAVVNHGSTGSGRNPDAASLTWFNPWLADVLNERGWIVAFPQRRGRGRSDGLYDEGFAKKRSRGYACNTRRSLAGADRALTDIRAAVVALRKRPDVADAPVLLAGASRGGALSIAYAGKYADDTSGAINFVGGWAGEGCRKATTINQSLFKKGGEFAKPTLWLYGLNDSYYSMLHSRRNFAAFRKNGGHGQFLEVTVPGKKNGHSVMFFPPLWTEAVNSYLDALKQHGK